MDFDIDKFNMTEFVGALYNEIEPAVLEALGYDSDFEGEIEIWGEWWPTGENVDFYVKAADVNGKYIDLLKVASPEFEKELHERLYDKAQDYLFDRYRLKQLDRSEDNE